MGMLVSRCVCRVWLKFGVAEGYPFCVPVGDVVESVPAVAFYPFDGYFCFVFRCVFLFVCVVVVEGVEVVSDGV